jgi:hypothetical protein
MEYFLAVHDSMVDGKKEVFGCITGRRVKDIVATIKKLTNAGVEVKYLMPKFQDRLYIGHLYSSAGAEVRYSGCMSYSLRYIVVDSQMVVIGVPEKVGESAATSRGHRISSDELASVLKRHFYDCWDKDTTFENYLQEVLTQTGTSIKQLAHELHLNEKMLEKILASATSES